MTHIREAMFCYLAATNVSCLNLSFTPKFHRRIFPHLKKISKDWKEHRPSNYEINPTISKMTLNLVNMEFRRKEKLQDNRVMPGSWSENDIFSKR